MENEIEIELPSGIDEYLETDNGIARISAKDLDELILKIRSNTGLEISQIKIIVSYLFQEIRNQLLKGNSVQINNFGTFNINRFYNVYFSNSHTVLNKINGK